MKYQFPTSWTTSPFKNVAEVITGTTPSTQYPEYYGGSVPFVGPAELGRAEPITQSPKSLSPAGVKRARLLPAESVLVCCIGATIGKVGFSGTNLATNQQINALIFNRKIIYPRYAFHYCRTLEPLIRHIGASTTLPLLPKGRFQELEIPLPPLEEQRRIAAILDKADEVRRKRKKAIALTEELLRSLFLDMFGDPVTNPKGWEVVKLKSQVSELRYGTSVKCHDVKENNDLPILRIPNIVNERISWNNLKYAQVESKEVSKLLLKPGDLLFVRTNGNPEYIARCALFEDNSGDTLYASYLIRGRLKSGSQLKPAFIRDTISFPTFRSHLVREARTTAGNYNINTEGLGRLRLIKPPLEEQESYLQFTQKLDIHSEIQKNQLEKIDNLFNSLLQKAFRGEL